MGDILQLPSRGSAVTAHLGWSCRDAGEISAHLHDARRRLLARGLANDGVAPSVLDAGLADEDSVQRFAFRVARSLSGKAGLDIGEVIYDCAAEAVAQDLPAEASAGLIGLLDADGRHALAVLGLSICAARLGRLQDARTLALKSFADVAHHPRTLLIAGYTEVRQGHVRQAQRYFAIASRIARQHPGFAAELRMAQRLLLMLQLA